MYKEITTIEEAFKIKGLPLLTIADLPSVPEKYTRGMVALYSLQVATEVVNNDDPSIPDWEPDYNDEGQYKWFPWYIGGDKTGSGFSFYVTYYDWTHTATRGGARLACKNEARARHMNKYFQDLYKELYLVLL